jgi:hypothetical protein
LRSAVAAAATRTQSAAPKARLKVRSGTPAIAGEVRTNPMTLIGRCMRMASSTLRVWR